MPLRRRAGDLSAGDEEEETRVDVPSESSPTERPTPGGAHVVRFCGELDLSSARCTCEALAAIRAPAIVVDLSELSYLDASGLSALVVARRRLALAGRRLTIRGARGGVRRVFEVTDLAHLLCDGRPGQEPPRA